MAFKLYQGKYKLTKPEKYIGNKGNIEFRSGWERAAFVWCERSDNVVKWASEEVVIPYLSPKDGRIHRYFVDLYIEMKSGQKWLIEIKPHKQTLPPKKPKKQSSRYLNESMTFMVNQKKWESAKSIAEKKGWKWAVWTENELRQLGILKEQKVAKPLRRLKPFARKKRG